MRHLLLIVPDTIVAGGGGAYVGKRQGGVQELVDTNHHAPVFGCDLQLCDASFGNRAVRPYGSGCSALSRPIPSDH